eukprot:GEMP01024776.1.p1 GENE.GEMP01024776.1~~GEMP01024776.1.p1  ORF type:complete len:798 (+),score=167.07 GEMP01024776.1:23-2395(+)
MKAENNPAIQVSTKVVADCTYVALFAPPPGGCIYAATTKIADGSRVAVDLLTPLSNLDVDFAKSDASIDLQSGSFEVKNIDELMSILEPYIMCSQACCLWDLTLTTEPPSKHPAFTAIFPGLRTYLPSTGSFYRSQPHAASSSTCVPWCKPPSPQSTSRHMAHSHTSILCTNCSGCEDTSEIDPICVMKSISGDIDEAGDVDATSRLRSTSHDSVPSTTCGDSDKAHNHDPTLVSMEEMSAVKVHSRPRSAATTCVGESAENSNGLTCDSAHIKEEIGNMENTWNNLSLRPQSTSCGAKNAHSNDPARVMHNNNDTHQDECCVVVIDPLGAPEEEDILNDPLVLEISKQANEKEDVMAVAAEVLLAGQDPHRASHQENENDDVDASGSSYFSPCSSESVRNNNCTSDATGSGDLECWICKDADGGPLIHPCLCKGSMQGVHLQCVEDWVAHVKQTKGERAQCPVCKTPYVGREVIPGLVRYTAYLGKYVCCITLRGLLLVLVLVLYWAALKGNLLANSTRVWVLILAAVFFVAKVAAITFAMPPRRTRFCYWTISDQEVSIEGSKSLLEMGGAFAILVFWCAFDEVEWVAFVPTALAIIPIGKWVISESCSIECFKRYALFLVTVMMCPCVTLMDACAEFQMMPRRYISPMNHLFHIIFSFAVLILCAIPSNEIILTTMVIHIAIIPIVLFLHACSKTWKLIRGRIWWVQIQVCLLSVYSVNVLRTSSGQKDWFQYSILTLSLVWYSLNMILGLTANWKSIKKQYDRWQRRHGSFTFQERQQRNAEVPAT